MTNINRPITTLADKLIAQRADGDRLRAAAIDALFAIESLIMLQGKKELQPYATQLRDAIWPNTFNDDDSSHTMRSSEDD